MNPEITLQKTIESYIAFLLEDDEKMFLVDVKILPGNNIRVFLDADNGLTIENCTRINRGLYKKIEEDSLFPGNNFSLEVSSPGIDESLKLLRQYKKNIGRLIDVTLNDEAKKTGKLTAVNDDEITIEEKEAKSKKAPDSYRDKITNILFNQIKHVRVQVTF